MRRAACLQKLSIDTVDLFGRVALEGAAAHVSVGGPFPLGVERPDDLFRVEGVAHPARKRSLDVLFVLRAFGELEPEPAIEGDRPRHVADDDAEEVELRSHDASAVAAVRNPSSGAIGCNAATTFRM